MEPDPALESSGPLHPVSSFLLASVGCVVPSSVLWLGAYAAAESGDVLLAAALAFAYAPAWCLTVVGLLAFLTRTRFVPLLGLASVTPLRLFAMYLAVGRFTVAAATVAPVSLAEWGLGVCVVGITASSLVRSPSFEGSVMASAGARSMALRCALAAGLTCLVSALFPLADLAGVMANTQVFGLVAFLLYGMWFVGLTGLSAARGAMLPTWLGGIVGAVPVAGVGVLWVMDPSVSALALAGLPAVVAGVAALPAVLAGSAIAWLLRLSEDLDDPKDLVPLEEDASLG